MSDVFKNIADAAGSSSVRRGFADLFSASKAALDEIQAGLGGILPSMPGMPVAKFGDLSIGIDMHPTVTPPSPIMPVPHVGKVYDLMADLMAGMAAAMPPALMEWPEWRATSSRVWLRRSRCITSGLRRQVSASCICRHLYCIRLRWSAVCPSPRCGWAVPLFWRTVRPVPPSHIRHSHATLWEYRRFPARGSPGR